MSYLNNHNDLSSGRLLFGDLLILAQAVCVKVISFSGF
jgi:hypothetical protein